MQYVDMPPMIRTETFERLLTRGGISDSVFLVRLCCHGPRGCSWFAVYTGSCILYRSQRYSGVRRVLNSSVIRWRLCSCTAPSVLFVSVLRVLHPTRLCHDPPRATLYPSLPRPPLQTPPDPPRASAAAAADSRQFGFPELRQPRGAVAGAFPAG